MLLRRVVRDFKFLIRVNLHLATIIFHEFIVLKMSNVFTKKEKNTRITFDQPCLCSLRKKKTGHVMKCRNETVIPCVLELFNSVWFIRTASRRSEKGNRNVLKHQLYAASWYCHTVSSFSISFFFFCVCIFLTVYGIRASVILITSRSGVQFWSAVRPEYFSADFYRTPDESR